MVHWIGATRAGFEPDDLIVETVVEAAIVVFEKLPVIVIEVVRPLQRQRFERIRLSVTHAGRRRIGAREAVKHVVETAIFLHDDNHVRDLSRRPGSLNVMPRRARKWSGLRQWCSA